MPKVITAILEIINSRRDRFGNCYWAFSFTDIDTGKMVVGKTGSAGESNIRSLLLYWSTPGEWDRSIHVTSSEMKIREFDRAVKDWPYVEPCGLNLAKFIRAELNK